MYLHYYAEKELECLISRPFVDVTEYILAFSTPMENIKGIVAALKALRTEIQVVKSDMEQ